MKKRRKKKDVGKKDKKEEEEKKEKKKRRKKKKKRRKRKEKRWKGMENCQQRVLTIAEECDFVVVGVARRMLDCCAYCC